jgi:lipoprotein Spr
MIRIFFTALAGIIVLASCSSTKPAASTTSRPVATKPATRSTTQPTTTPAKNNDVRFLDAITANPGLSETVPETQIESSGSPAANLKQSSSKASASSLQIKYAELLNTEAEQIETTELLKSVDDWYGTRYRMGGTTKSGVDCSALVQSVYLAAFGLSVPRTAFEQYKAAQRISATDMKEGDLVFFNTTGGVSHVGIYLRNNKFIHASSSRGVCVSDLFDPYYLRRFLGVGRIERSLGTR